MSSQYVMKAIKLHLNTDTSYLWCLLSLENLMKMSPKYRGYCDATLHDISSPICPSYSLWNPANFNRWTIPVGLLEPIVWARVPTHELWQLNYGLPRCLSYHPRVYLIRMSTNPHVLSDSVSDQPAVLQSHAAISRNWRLIKTNKATWHPALLKSSDHLLSSRVSGVIFAPKIGGERQAFGIIGLAEILTLSLHRHVIYR